SQQYCDDRDVAALVAIGDEEELGGSQFIYRVRPLDRRLSAERNSSRVCFWVRNAPSIRLVTIVTSVLCTPLVVMHSCAASTTTPTPWGLSPELRQLAISAVIFSWTCRRRANVSTRRANLEMPITRLRGR